MIIHWICQILRYQLISHLFKLLTSVETNVCPQSAVEDSGQNEMATQDLGINGPFDERHILSLQNKNYPIMGMTNMQ
jgi:hypothetical protein